MHRPVGACLVEGRVAAAVLVLTLEGVVTVLLLDVSTAVNGTSFCNVLLHNVMYLIYLSYLGI